MRSLHVLCLITPLSLVAAQDCDASDPFGTNCDDSAPAIAIDGAQALCSYILNSCPGGFPAATLCVTNWCQTGCADPNNCCSSSDPSTCFQSSSGTPQGSGSEPQNPGLAECTSVVDYVNYCESATPGFSTLPNTAQASCFCFNENGSYNGTAWDDAATSCYAAMGSQTSVSTSELSAYSANVVGACTKFVDAGVLSSAGVSSGGAAPTAAPAGSGSSTSSSTPTATSSASSGAQAGTPSPSATKSSAKSGASKRLGGCAVLLGAILAISCMVASL